MIEIDRTDEEREELVKQWIKDYWLAAVGAAALAIALVYGLNYYRQSKLNALSDTADEVQLVTADLQANKMDSAKVTVEKLQAAQSDTTFSAVATLHLAKKLFDESKYVEAAKQYQWLITNADDVVMRDIARLRKARAESNAKQYSEAVSTLSGLESQSYVVESNLLKGDVYMANKQFDAAKKAYESIKAESGLHPDMIQQRLDLLSIKQQKAL